ncbi:MAG TPA: acyltransferase [Acidimicrobiales bacterium]|nr:acyltransferase [Acidimicrobiales bacterium]
MTAVGTTGPASDSPTTAGSDTAPSDTAPSDTAPASPRAVRGRYLPAPDGLRGVSMLCIFAYHLQYGWAAGGYIAVDVFFVLSGFLITSLLVEEWVGTGGIRLRAFWGRRAKRLLPGLMAMLILLSIWVALTKSGTQIDLGTVRSGALGSLFYFANWQQIFLHQSYFAQFAAQSPLRHTWTLAIEEQFYLVWPLVMLLILRGFGRRGRTRRAKEPMAVGHHGAHLPGAHLPGGDRRKTMESWRRTGLIVTVGGSLLSAAWMAWLRHHGASVNRVYLGTDTRAFDLLAGGAVAFWAASRPEPGRAARRALHLAAMVAVAVFVVCWWRDAIPFSAGPPSWMTDGGFLLVAVSIATVIADIRQVAYGPVGALLAVRPLRWVGKISYGLYLWHWPVIVELSPARTGLNGLLLDGLRVLVTFGLASLSWYLLESRMKKARFTGWRRPTKLALAPVAVAVTALVAVAATVPVTASAGPAGRTRVVHRVGAVPGAGGLTGQKPIALNGTPTAQSPLHVTLLGDSVMFVDAPAVQAALQSTGVVTVAPRAIVGWGLSTDHNWRHDVAANIADSGGQLVVAMWSWDDSWALAHRAQYKKVLEQFVRVVLAPGDGVAGLVFQQFPTPGPVVGDAGSSQTAADTASRLAGVKVWNALAGSMTKLFPGRVMYFPVGASVELGGHFSTWLPSNGKTSQPKADWVRIRMVDNVHLCPAGATLYADALLADLTSLYHLPAPASAWSTGPWTADPRFSHSNGLSSTPCPDDHPPS